MGNVPAKLLKDIRGIAVRKTMSFNVSWYMF